jgi:alcohol dehydrogenase class IV
VRSFVHVGLPSRTVFGAGSLDTLEREVDRLGAKRVLVLCTPRQRALAEAVPQRLGARAAGIFDQAVMHVPIETAVAARAAAQELGADGSVAIGGGSTIGLAKALALPADVLAAASGGAPVAGPSVPAVVAIPTTFSGSEMTPLYGVTAGGQKKTGRDARVMPRTVIYDPLLLANLPPAVAGPSGMNAIAHCAEALYAEDANPITSLMAEEGMRALAASLPRVVGVGSGPIGVDVRGEARAEALYGAWLAGNCLGAVGMALHHKLCHTLGGSFNLPHAETHTIVLPHALRYNREAAPEAMSRMSRALTAAGPGAADPAARLHDLARALGAPLGLRQIGLPAEALDQVADLALRNPYYNPRPLERTAIRQLLQDAWEGRRPSVA